MKRTMEYGAMLQVQDDLLRVKKDSPGLAFLLDNKISAFLFQKDNARELKIINDRLHEIQKKYIVHDEKDYPQYASREQGKDAEWQYLESVTLKDGTVLTGEQVKEAYMRDMEAFLGRSGTIII